MDTQIVLDGQKLKSLIIPEWARVGAAFKLSVSQVKSQLSNMKLSRKKKYQIKYIYLQVSSPFKFWFLFHLHTAELSALMKNLK